MPRMRGAEAHDAPPDPLVGWTPLPKNSTPLASSALRSSRRRRSLLAASAPRF